MDKKSNNLKKLILEKGASKVGFADLSDIELDGYPGVTGAISIAYALNPKIIAGIKEGPTVEYYEEYCRANNFLDVLGEYTAGLLEKLNHKAIPLRPTDKIETSTLTSVSKFSHKMAATRAGIGWIGKPALLVTREFGSAVRINTVLTDVELEWDSPINDSSCGSCQECMEACPAEAVQGLNWTIDKEREDIYDAFKCYKTVLELCGEAGINSSICGICIANCPWTEKYLAEEENNDEILE